MSRTGVRRVLVGTATILVIACNQNRSEVTGPSAASSTPAALVSSRPSAEPVTIVGGSAVKPEGFQTAIFSDPKRNADGQIIGESPLTVEFDACRSTAGEGGTLHFYFDWDFDHRADVWGTGDACRQVHTYKLQPVENARGNETIVTNICVTTGDLKQHNPETYVSCREFTIVMPRVSAGGGSCHALSGAGFACPTGAAQFCVNGGISATNSAHAQAACETCFGAGACVDSPTSIGGRVWFAGGSLYWYESALFPFVVCTTFVPQAGDLTDNVGCPSGRWAP